MQQGSPWGKTRGGPGFHLDLPSMPYGLRGGGSIPASVTFPAEGQGGVHGAQEVLSLGGSAPVHLSLRVCPASARLAVCLVGGESQVEVLQMCKATQL